MLRVFNMGVGMVLVVRGRDAAAVASRLGGRVIGRVERGERGVEFA
jgi:phosphoribosylaminoimidazole (AIR) synthetase